MSARETIEAYMNPPLWSRVLTQAICIGAIHLSGKRLLARWVALEKACPSRTIIKETPKPPTKPSFCARWFPLAMSMVFMGVSVNNAISLWWKTYATPRIVLDVVWGFMMLSSWTTAFAQTLYHLFPRSRVVTRVRGKGDLTARKWSFNIDTAGDTGRRFAWTNPDFNWAVGAITAAGFMMSNFFGYHELLPLACGCMVIFMHSGWYAQKIQLRWIIYLESGVLLLIALVFGLVALFPSKEKSSPDQYPVGQPSAWLFGIMNVWTSSIMFAVPGTFMIVNMRYEHTRVTPPVSQGAPGEGILIDNRTPLPSMPLHIIAMTTFATCCAVFDLLAYFEYTKNGFFDLGGIMISGIIAVIAACAATTFIRGDLKDWWYYTEVYNPEIDFTTVTELDEDSQLIDEKRPVSP